MMNLNNRFSLLLLLGLLLPFSAITQYNPTFSQNGTTNSTLSEVITNNADAGTATFILLGDGRFRLGEGNSITRQHNYPVKDTTYTCKAYFVRKYKDDPPTARSASVNIVTGASSTVNPDVQMTACTRIGTSWYPSPGKKHFTILSFTNTCSDTAVSGTIKFYYKSQQNFATDTNCLKLYNQWITSPTISSSDDSNYDLMLVANYSNLTRGEIRHVYLFGDVNMSVSAGDPLYMKFKITGMPCGTTEVSASIDAQKYPHDPNEKTVNKDEVCSRNMMPHELGYRIAFHNDGENFADTIQVSDQFEPRLLWPTAQLTASSAPCVSIPGLVTRFRFPGIKLPGLNQTSPHLYTYEETIGWLTFNIQTTPCLNPFEVILNKASVVFDLQPAIETTQAKTVVTEATCGPNSCGAPRPARRDDTDIDAETFSVGPNPVSDQLQISFLAHGKWQLNLYSMQGDAVWHQSGEGTADQQFLLVESIQWAPGIYFLRWQDGEIIRTTKIMKL